MQQRDIEMDPEWKKGEYTAQPKVGLSEQLVN
jgi:homoserine acetyltransferase